MQARTAQKIIGSHTIQYPMCGLDVIITLCCDIRHSELGFLDVDHVSESDLADHLRRFIVNNRGPDYSNSVVVSEPEFRIDMFSSVLQIQGDELCPQPLYSELTGSVLLWNGEYLNHHVSSQSDTKLVLEGLDAGESPVFALNEVEGPFAFVFYDRRSNRVWFGKDRLGRRSLLVRIDSQAKQLVISSTSLPGGSEIPAGEGIFSLSLISGEISAHPWLTESFLYRSSFLSGEDKGDSALLCETFRSGIRRHVESTTVAASLVVLFSGGVDSAILAALAAEVVVSGEKSFVKKIDLINVACAGTPSPDRATGLVTYSQILSRFPKDLFRFISVDISAEEVEKYSENILALAAPNNTVMDLNISTALWFAGRGKGRVLDPSFVDDPQWPLLLTQITASESVESAVENKRPKKGPPSTLLDDNKQCTVCLRRKMKPGCALHACKLCCKDSSCPAHTPFVTQKVGNEISVEKFIEQYLTEAVTSTGRVLLVGHGADELFGGYGRHETRAVRGGLESLRSEMLVDLKRLWSRNLGRDDRIIADHARDTRHPFLDEAVIEYVASLSTEAMAGVNGENKPLLRQIARSLGMTAAATFRKRAIQFGTRLAQQTNVAMFGSHSQGSGRAAVLTKKLENG